MRHNSWIIQFPKLMLHNIFHHENRAKIIAIKKKVVLYFYGHDFSRILKVVRSLYSSRVVILYFRGKINKSVSTELFFLLILLIAAMPCHVARNGIVNVIYISQFYLLLLLYIVVWREPQWNGNKISINLWGFHQLLFIKVIEKGLQCKGGGGMSATTRSSDVCHGLAWMP